MVQLTYLAPYCQYSAKMELPRSDRLGSEAIVEFVRAMCEVAREELAPVAAPRVYSLTKIVEISHFNMSRIRRALYILEAQTMPEVRADITSHLLFICV